MDFSEGLGRLAQLLTSLHKGELLTLRAEPSSWSGAVLHIQGIQNPKPDTKHQECLLVAAKEKMPLPCFSELQHLLPPASNPYHP